MPELPEVETVVRGLNEQVAGLTVKRVAHISDHLLSRDKELHRLKGETIEFFERRGKFMIARMKSGRRLLLHLRMSGRFIFEDERRGRERHDHLILSFTDRSERLIFRDIRKFGVIEWVGSSQQSALDRLGIEAPEITARALYRLLPPSKKPIKALLLDQHKIAGVGNIYADEALFRSRVHPLTPCNAITKEDSGRLARAIRYILRTAIEKMGTTFDSYSGVNGNPGQYAKYLRVYGHAGQACPRCRSVIRKIRSAGRGTHFCPGCQKQRTSKRRGNIR